MARAIAPLRERLTELEAETVRLAALLEGAGIDSAEAAARLRSAGAP